MPLYNVEITYDQGAARARDTHSFEAADDEAAHAYMKKNDGMCLCMLRRDVAFKHDTLTRATE